MNNAKDIPVDVYITVGVLLPSERSKRAATEVRLRLKRKNNSRQLLRKLLYTHPVKCNHISRVETTTVVKKDLR